jgi:pimeloyl-ACP methyl ester carboxylesterase
VAGPADGWLERDGVTLHYLAWTPDAPGTEPPLLLLHGLSSNANYWGRLARRISDRRLIALDQRGHGHTGLPPHAPSIPRGLAMDELLADVAHAVNELGLGRPVIVGHSWGATVALELVARFPTLASGLVFIDGPVQSASNLFSWEQAQSFMQPPLPRYASFAQAIDDARRDFSSAWGEDLEPFVFSRVMQDGTDLILTLTAPARLELLRGLYHSPVELLWTQLEVPAAALLARGGPERLTGWRESGARRLNEIAPKVEIRWFDTPHDIPLVAPEEVAVEVRRVGSEAAAGQQLQG